MRTRVEVTAEDIEKGSRCNGWNCPVHRGLWRATGQTWNVYSSWAIAVEPQPRRTISLPSEAIVFNNRFDGGLPVQPFTFEVDIPEGGNAETRRTCKPRQLFEPRHGGRNAVRSQRQ
jgi:hypothetical protein